MSPCEAYAALLDAFLDGEATAEQAAEVQRHLEGCPACRAYMDDISAIRAALPDPEETELPEGFTASVMEAVGRTPQSRPKRQPWGKLAAAAACLALIVLLQKTDLPRGGGFGMAGSAAPASAAPAAAAPMAPPLGEERNGMTVYAAEDGSLLEEIAESAPEPESFEESNALAEGVEPASGRGDVPTAPAAPGTETASGSTAVKDAGFRKNAALTLRREAADCLADYVPFEETDASAWYELAPADYTALLKALPEELIVPPVLPVSEGENVIVALLK